MSDYVSLKELADELGLDRSNMRKYVLKHGFMPTNVRTADSRSQLTLALSAEDAEAVRQLRTSQGYTSGYKPMENGDGYFYVIQLIPELDPCRVKLGWTNGLDGRLASHRTAAPTAQLIKAWPCKKAWELAAMASLTRMGCTLIANEVYTCDSVDAVVSRGDQFFSLMP
jgi:hypothetical protein